MRLIDADELKEEVKTMFCPDGYKIMMLKDIDNAPTVDFPDWYKVYEDVKGTFERPQGEWIMIKNSDGYLKCYECSECKKSQGYTSNFCEYCGADMRGKEE